MLMYVLNSYVIITFLVLGKISESFLDRVLRIPPRCDKTALPPLPQGYAAEAICSGGFALRGSSFSLDFCSALVR